MSDLNKRIVYLSDAYHGSCHDYKILKSEFNPKQAKWFEGLELIVDLGFLGIQKDYPAKVKIPDKKPRKRTLTKAQKRYNRSVSQIRIKVEHAIGGLKRYRILADRLRIRNMIRYNQIAGICAGLWNFILNT